MNKRQAHAVRRLAQARAAHKYNPNHQTQLELERAEARYVAAMSYTKTYTERKL